MSKSFSFIIYYFYDISFTNKFIKNPERYISIKHAIATIIIDANNNMVYSVHFLVISLFNAPFPDCPLFCSNKKQKAKNVIKK